MTAALENKMKCRKCGEELTEDDIATVIAEHDEKLLDIIATCPECGHKINNFLDMSEAIDLN
jgi:DNA-directed RNA polymerase subunit RPC12/RpoP